MAPARVFYVRTRYDFDPGLVDPTNPPVRLSKPGVVRELLRRHHPVVEVNEPTIVTEWSFLLAQIAAVRLRDAVTRRRTTIVTYCIGLTDPASRLAQLRRLPRWLAWPIARTVLAVLLRSTDRLAFGTSAAQALYETYADRRRLADKSRLFEALPSVCDCMSGTGTTGERRTPTQLCFVGKLSDRKGIRQVMATWELVRRDHPDATLRVLGKGELEHEVVAWAADRPEVSVEIDPAREVIHRTLRQSGALICLSQPHEVREQVGLPIVEGLGHGCEVVATTETGLAPWLTDHGHGVVAPDAPPREVADEVAAAFTRAATRRGSLADLPREDQRIAVDRWLMTGQVEATTDDLDGGAL
jgi:glycosyltransferase involved in cell wall biosynthesis